MQLNAKKIGKSNRFLLPMNPMVKNNVNSSEFL